MKTDRTTSGYSIQRTRAQVPGAVPTELGFCESLSGMS